MNRCVQEEAEEEPRGVKTREIEEASGNGAFIPSKSSERGGRWARGRWRRRGEEVFVGVYMSVTFFPHLMVGVSRRPTANLAKPPQGAERQSGRERFPHQ